MTTTQRLRNLLIFSALLTGLVLLAACSTSSDPILPVDGDDTTDGDTPDGDAPDGDAPDGDAPDGDDPDGDDSDGDDEPTCKSYEDGCCVQDSDCLQGRCFANVCVVPPTEEVSVWWENSYYDEEEGHKVGTFDEFYEGSVPAAPDFSCVSGLEDVDDAGTVTVRGTLKVFGVKAPCTQLKVQTFTQFDDFGAHRTEFPASEVVASAVVEDFPDENFECHVTMHDVPVGRWLVFKTYDEGNIQFRDTYQYNVYIKPEEVGQGEFEIEINAISNTSWELVPLTAGVSNGVQSDRGAISGTVKDCQGRLLGGATIGLSVMPTKLAYFNADVEDLLPDPTRTTTNVDSTFAAINQPSELVKIVALAMVNGSIEVIYTSTIYMVPQTVSIYGLRGAQPSNYGYFDPPN